jgi:mRNA-decapping enzyme subunit 2
LWTFPGGKINQGEAHYNCAIREVSPHLEVLLIIQVCEELGVDVSEYLNKELYIDNIAGRRDVRMYVVPYVPEETTFHPNARNEIEVCLVSVRTAKRKENRMGSLGSIGQSPQAQGRV